METLKFKIIKSKDQYIEYCNMMEKMVLSKDEYVRDEIELLALLIEKWDTEHSSLIDMNPVELLKALLVEHKMKAQDLVDVLDLSKGTISKILNYHKGFSKETIRRLAEYFKISQKAFNRPYKLNPEDSLPVYNEITPKILRKIIETS